ncbi:MAG TPA: hypothetical protein VGH91_13750 [Gammaproteobacteria bacterium]
MKKIALIVTVASLMGVAATAGYAAGSRHPNLNKAQDLVTKAIARLEDAQKDNEDKLGGHAKNAEGFLKQAQPEITAALQDAESKK